MASLGTRDRSETADTPEAVSGRPIMSCGRPSWLAANLHRYAYPGRGSVRPDPRTESASEMSKYDDQEEDA